MQCATVNGLIYGSVILHFVAFDALTDIFGECFVQSQAPHTLTVLVSRISIAFANVNGCPPLRMQQKCHRDECLLSATTTTVCVCVGVTCEKETVSFACTNRT